VVHTSNIQSGFGVGVGGENKQQPRSRQIQGFFPFDRLRVRMTNFLEQKKMLVRLR
jgi:hypothetical protein